MDLDLEEEIFSWFQETNGSASLMSEWFDIPIRTAKNLIEKWEGNDNSNSEDWDSY